MIKCLQECLGYELESKRNNKRCPLRLSGYPGSHARAEDGCSQRRGRNPGSDEGLLQGGLQCGEPL